MIVLTGCTKVVPEVDNTPVNSEPTSFENIDTTIIPEGCISWFDGCNTCIILNGQIAGCTKMYCEQMLEPKCKQWQE